MMWLSPTEYKKITSEISSNYKIYEGKEYAAHISIGTDNGYYIYYFVNKGFDDYTIVKKVKF